jgi:pectate lyase
MKKLLVTLLCGGFLSACAPAGDGGSGSGGRTIAGTGGAAVGSGGNTTVGTGGQSTSSGGTSAATGGASANGGASSGGASSGGASSGGANSGGTSATGGKTATGGTNSGGSSATGGTIATTGGTTATGGKAATGGTSSGGSSATGGTTATGCGTPTTTGKGPAETKPVGYGQAATGGGSAAPVEVATMAALQAAVTAYSGTGGLVLKYTGKFNFASISDPCAQHSLEAQFVEIKNKSNITILGADGSAANFGIALKGAAKNIIIRNMTFGLLPGGDKADIISIEGVGGGIPTDIWIDHNELFTSLADCAGAGDASFDGLIDMKSGADNVTISYNFLHDHHKGTLVGFTDKDDSSRHVTYHHNIFQNIGSRTPLQRHGHSHSFSNYYNQITTSGINVRMSGYALIESNFFENSKNIVTSRDSPETGYWELRANNIASPADFAKCAITWTTSTDVLKNADDWTTTKTFPVALGYGYTADPPNCVKYGLSAVAGAGKGMATLKCN